MQHTHTDFTAFKQSRGGRVSSPALRENQQKAQDFSGLEEGIKPLDLLTLAKRAGEGAGFTDGMLKLLEHYMLFTREADWGEGSQPIVYKAIDQTAMDLNMSSRHVRRLEKQLADLGALTWNDSGNCKRYGQRCPKTGRILFAFGVDLTPLAYMQAELQNIVHEQQLYKAAWMESKRQLSWYRSQIRSILAEMIEFDQSRAGELMVSYDEIATRYCVTDSLEVMREKITQHKDLHDQVLEVLNTLYSPNEVNKESCKTDSDDLHKHNTTQNPFNKLNTRSASHNGFPKKRTENSDDELASNVSLRRKEKHSEPEAANDPENRAVEEAESILEKAGLQHISGKQLLNAASSRFKDHIPMHDRALNFEDIVEAAYRMRKMLHINNGSWIRACETLTKYGAAVCLLLTDQATQREENPVRVPAAYFNAMISKARAGELRLHKSVFGLLKREDESFNDNFDDKSNKQGRN